MYFEFVHVGVLVLTGKSGSNWNVTYLVSRLNKYIKPVFPILFLLLDGGMLLT